MPNKPSTQARILTEGYIPTSQRDGCARCKHVVLKNYVTGHNGKTFHCPPLRAYVQAYAICHRFESNKCLASSEKSTTPSPIQQSSNGFESLTP